MREYEFIKFKDKNGTITPVERTAIYKISFKLVRLSQKVHLLQGLT